MADVNEKIAHHGFTKEELVLWKETQLMYRGVPALTIADYVVWLQRKKGLSVAKTTIANYIKDGHIDAIHEEAFFYENKGITDTGKEKKRKFVRVIMTQKTINFEGINDGERPGRPAKHVQQRKKLDSLKKSIK